MKIGVFGGSFDPPHAGHLALAKAAIQKLELDEVVFLPTNRNPDKKYRAAPPRERLAMVKLLIEGEPKMAVSDIEITRGGLSYTVDTMTELTTAQAADYWFLLGADAARTIDKWKQPQRLVRLCRLGVAMRPPNTEQDLMMWIPDAAKAVVDIVPMKPIDISSSEIRNRISNGLQPGPNMPTSVHEYIKAHKLYLT